jgi:hypothetical protein
MAMSHVKRQELRKSIGKGLYDAPFYDGRLTVKDDKIFMDGTINYSFHEREKFRGDLKTFEERMKKKFR